MSTFILYHAFGLKGIRYNATRYEGEYLIFEACLLRRKAATDSEVIRPPIPRETGH